MTTFVANSSPRDNKEHFINDIRPVSVNPKIEEVLLDRDDEHVCQIEYLASTEPDLEHHQHEGSQSILETDDQVNAIDEDVTVIAQASNTEDEDNIVQSIDCALRHENSPERVTDITAESHIHESEMLYDNSLNDHQLNEQYFSSGTTSQDCRSTEKLNSHFLSPGTSKEIIKLQKTLMMRQFEMLQERHNLEMEILQNELEFKKIEHRKKLELMDKKLTD